MNEKIDNKSPFAQFLGKKYEGKEQQNERNRYGCSKSNNNQLEIDYLNNQKSIIFEPEGGGTSDQVSFHDISGQMNTRKDKQFNDSGLSRLIEQNQNQSRIMKTPAPTTNSIFNTLFQKGPTQNMDTDESNFNQILENIHTGSKQSHFEDKDIEIQFLNQQKKKRQTSKINLEVNEGKVQEMDDQVQTSNDLDSDDSKIGKQFKVMKTDKLNFKNFEEQAEEASHRCKRSSLLQEFACDMKECYNKQKLSQLLKQNILSTIKNENVDVKRRKNKLIYRYNEQAYGNMRKIEKEIDQQWQKKIKEISKNQINMTRNMMEQLDLPDYNSKDVCKKHQVFDVCDYNKDKSQVQEESFSNQIQQSMNVAGSMSGKGDDSDLSELDEKDLTLLFCGAHQNFFEAKHEFDKIISKEIDKKKKPQQNGLFSFFNRNNQNRLEEQKAKLVTNLRSKLRDMVDEQKAEINRQQSIIPVQLTNQSSVNIGALKRMSTVLTFGRNKNNINSTEDFGNSKGGQFQSEEKPRLGPKRTGKELWAIARTLVYKKVKKKDLAHTMMEALREARLKKQQQLREKNEQLEREKFLQMQQQMDNDDEDLAETMTCYEKLDYIIWKYYARCLVYNDNKKLGYFHLMVSITFFVDFYITGLIMGNFMFLTDQQSDFIDHKRNYILICIIQSMDIILNFFKSDYKMKSKEIFFYYLKGYFLYDLIAVVPYTFLMRPLIFLRYLKLMKYRTYLQYFEDFAVEMCKFMNYKQLQIFKSMLRLVIQLCMVSHLFASFWCLIGNYLYQHEQGWIYNNHDSGIQELDFTSIYTSSIYWVITTFTSIGYGDIYGHSIIEYMYIILVQMVGMCFFGYMMGTFQQLIQDLAEDDQFVVEQDKLDQWLIKLNKCVKDRTLSPIIFKGVQDFQAHRFKLNPYIVMEYQIFHQLKPRMRRLTLDFIFAQFYTKFKTIFEECEIEFIREVFMHSQYAFFHDENEDEDDENGGGTNQKDDQMDNLSKHNEILECGHTYREHVWFDKPQKPTIIEAGKKSTNIYFIISGRVYIMDSNCQIEYGVLYNGSMFGEISLFFEEPNQFSYAYNPFQKYPPLQCLSIDSKIFAKICRKYPLSFESLLKVAYQRKKIFEKYRSISLLSLMKGVIHFDGLFQKITQEKTIAERIQIGEFYNVRMNLFKCMYHMYQLQNLTQKKTYLQDKLINQHIQEKKKVKAMMKGEGQPDPKDKEEVSSLQSFEEKEQQMMLDTIQTKAKMQRRMTTFNNQQQSMIHLKQFMNNESGFFKLPNNTPKLAFQPHLTFDKLQTIKQTNESEDSKSSSQESEQSSNSNSSQSQSSGSSLKTEVRKETISDHSEPQISVEHVDKSPILNQSSQMIKKSNADEIEIDHQISPQKDITKINEPSIIDESQEMLLNNFVSVSENMLNIKEGGAPNDNEYVLSQNNIIDQSNSNESEQNQTKLESQKSKTTSQTDKLQQKNPDTQQKPSIKLNMSQKMSRQCNNAENSNLQRPPIQQDKQKPQNSPRQGRAIKENNMPPRQRVTKPPISQPDTPNQSRQRIGQGLTSQKQIQPLASTAPRKQRRGNSYQTVSGGRRNRQAKGSSITGEGNTGQQAEEHRKTNTTHNKNFIQNMFEGGETLHSEIDESPKRDGRKSISKSNKRRTQSVDKNQNNLSLSPDSGLIRKSTIILKTQKSLNKAKQQEKSMKNMFQKMVMNCDESINNEKDCSGCHSDDSSSNQDNKSHTINDGSSVQIKNDEDLEKIVTKQIHTGLKMYFKQQIEEQNGKRTTDFHDQLHHFNEIIEEFTDLKTLVYNKESGQNAEVFLSKYLSLIDQGEFTKSFIPRTISSLIKGRKKYQKKYKKENPDAEQLSTTEIDLLTMQKNLENIISYKQYQEEQLFHIQNTDHDIDQAMQSQQLIQNSLYRQLDNNKQFKLIYDEKVEEISDQMEYLQFMVQEKMDRIAQLQQSIINFKIQQSHL